MIEEKILGRYRGLWIRHALRLVISPGRSQN